MTIYRCDRCKKEFEDDKALSNVYLPMRSYEADSLGKPKFRVVDVCESCTRILMDLSEDFLYPPQESKNSDDKEASLGTPTRKSRI